MREQIDYREAEGLASKISSSANKIKSILENSDSVVKKIQENWKGVAADSAQENWNKWKKDFEEYHSILMQNVTNIQKSAHEFAEAEARMQQNFQQ